MKPIFHRILIFTMLASVFAGCELRFGEDTNLSGSEISPSHIRQIEQLTSIALPNGAIGDHYFYMGSGIDDAMFVQLHWQRDARAELATALGAISATEEQGLAAPPGMEWWAPEKLSNPRYLGKELPNGKYLKCVYGMSGADTLLYVFWHEK